MSQPVELSGQIGTVVRTHVVKRVLKNPMGLIAIVILVLVIAMAAFADLLAPFDPNFANIGKSLANPDGVNILGTDSVGRDIWSRLVFGARTTLLSALLCAAVAIVIGLPSGLIAGYYGGKFDAAANWIVNITMSLP
ncbi:MAG TPA: ABC transporter, partial [Arthrobacter bacterium]|nr:ABC transporter [Arthrobacter sp.]